MNVQGRISRILVTGGSTALYAQANLSGPQAKKTDSLNPYASPLLGNLQDLPPSTVITDGFDPLRDEGAAYADKLRQAGVSVMYRNFETGTHEFFGMGAVVDLSNQAVQYAAQNLKTAFGQ